MRRLSTSSREWTAVAAIAESVDGSRFDSCLSPGDQSQEDPVRVEEGTARTPQDTGGHGVKPVRDREAPGSNPGPSTKIVFKSRFSRAPSSQRDYREITDLLATLRNLSEPTAIRARRCAFRRLDAPPSTSQMQGPGLTARRESPTRWIEISRIDLRADRTRRNTQLAR
jgi:hypothetical protein